MTDTTDNKPSTGNIEAFEGKTPDIAPDVFVAATASIIGDVTIGAGSSIWYGCVLRGDDHAIVIGEGTNVQDGSLLHATLDGEPTILGDRVIIGHGAKLHSCTIGDGALVGIGSIILDGCVLEPDSMLAAGALLTPNKRVPSGELWGGSPAKKLRDLNDKDREYLSWDAAHYLKLAQKYRNR